MQEYIQDIRDVIMTDEAMTRTTSVAQTLMANGLNYPHIGEDKANLVQMDAIAGDNFQEFRLEAKRFVRLLKKRTKTTKPLLDNFAIHRTFKVVAKNEKVLYLPVSLEFDDGQVLTGLVRQYGDDAGNYFNRKSFMKITKWFLNEQDITKEVYLTKRDVIDENRLAKNMGAIIDTVHTKFVKKNPNASKVVEGKESLLKEIEELKAKRDELKNTLDNIDTIDKAKLEELSKLAKEKDLTVVKKANGEVSINKGSGGRLSTLVEVLKTSSYKEAKSFITSYEAPPKKEPKIKLLGTPSDKKEAEKLLNMFDWNAWAIDDGEKYNQVEEQNTNILKKLGGLGVTAIERDEGDGNKPIRYEVPDSQYKDANIDKELTSRISRVAPEYVVYKLGANYFEIIEKGKDKLVMSGEYDDINEYIEKEKITRYKPRTKTLDFINKVFGRLGLFNTNAVAEYLENDLELPRVSNPAIFRNGLSNKGYMGEGATFMQGFYNLKQDFLKPSKNAGSKNIVEKIKNDPIYKKVIADSMGGVMYDTNKKYDADHLLKLWNELSEAEKENADGIMKGVMDFLNEQSQQIDEQKDYKKAILELLKVKDVNIVEEKLDTLADELESKGLLDDYEDALKQVTSYITKLYEEEQ